MASAGEKVDVLIKALKKNKFSGAAKSAGAAKKLVEKCGPEIGDVSTDLADWAVNRFSEGKQKERLRQIYKVICMEILISFLANAES